MHTIKRIPLQTRVLALISSILLFVIILLATIFAYMQVADTKGQVRQLALQSAKTISLMPELRVAIEDGNLDAHFRPIAEQVLDQVQAENIVIENRKEIIYSHTNPSRVGEASLDHTSYHALLFGGANDFTVEQEHGSVLIGKVPIIADYGDYSKVIGTVSVEFSVKEIYQSIYKRIETIAIASALIFLLGVLGSVYLTRSIRKDTMGHEPHEIAALYMDTIAEVRDYSEGLRAQTHEYANKLYLLSGLLQLERYGDAFEFIQKESVSHQQRNQILFNQINDANVQAILLGKFGRASEQKIVFEIDADSYLDPLPSHIEVTDIITIIGNLVDNAFEAVSQQQEKKVTFSIIGNGNDIIIEVMDTGKGISDDLFDSLFSIGQSSKGKHRGYGLFNVKRIVESLGGTIEVNHGKSGGAIFTVYLPKGLS